MSEVTVNDIRAWANETGLAVGKRGRISHALVQQYNAANPRKKFTGDKH